MPLKFHFIWNYGISFQVITQCCTALCAVQDTHKNNVIGRISARAFRERGVAFQSMDQVKRCDGLSLWNEHDDHYFYCIILVNKLFPLNWRNLENIQPLIQRKTRQFPKRIFIYPDVRRRLLCRAWRVLLWIQHGVRVLICSSVHQLWKYFFQLGVWLRMLCHVVPQLFQWILLRVVKMMVGL